jgi:hypothetical protein
MIFRVTLSLYGLLHFLKGTLNKMQRPETRRIEPCGSGSKSAVRSWNRTRRQHAKPTPTMRAASIHATATTAQTTVLSATRYIQRTSVSCYRHLASITAKRLNSTISPRMTRKTAPLTVSLCRDTTPLWDAWWKLKRTSRRTMLRASAMALVRVIRSIQLRGRGSVTRRSL